MYAAQHRAVPSLSPPISSSSSPYTLKTIETVKTLLYHSRWSCAITKAGTGPSVISFIHKLTSSVVIHCWPKILPNSVIVSYLGVIIRILMTVGILSHNIFCILFLSNKLNIFCFLIFYCPKIIKKYFLLI